MDSQKEFLKKVIDNDYFRELFLGSKNGLGDFFLTILDSKIFGRIKDYLSKAIRIDRDYNNITVTKENLYFFESKDIQNISSYDLEILGLLENLNLVEISLNAGTRPIDSLSSGEKALVRLFSIFANSPIPQNRENILFMYDEPENSLHPRWQQEFMNIFKYVAEDIYHISNSHFIFSTHSPLIIQRLGLHKNKNTSVLKFFKDEKGCTHTEVLEDIYAFNIEQLLLDEFLITYRSEDSVQDTFFKVKEIISNKKDNDPLKSVLKSFELKDKIEKMLNDIG